MVLRWAVEVQGRYRGPAAATLATLASFTFLVNSAVPFGTQLRLQASTYKLTSALDSG